MAEAAPRPAAITVIGWIWVVLGAMMAFSGANALIVSTLFLGGAEAAPQADVLGPVFAFMFQHFTALALVQVIFALFVVFSAIRFLQRRAWARRGLQFINWLLLLYIVLFGVNWVYALTTAVSTARADGEKLPPAANAGLVVFVVMGILVTLTLAAPLIVMLRYLGKSAVKDACNR